MQVCRLPDWPDLTIAEETGHGAMLKYLGLEPILDLGMRLGEGTGAALTINLCETACSVMRNMASFDEADHMVIWQRILDRDYPTA